MNGEYGKLKSYSEFKQKEEKTRQLKAAEEKELRESEEYFSELETEIQQLTTKADAIKFIAENCKTEFHTPMFKEVMEKFEITKSEISEWRATHNEV